MAEVNSLQINKNAGKTHRQVLGIDSKNGDSFHKKVKIAFCNNKKKSYQGVDLARKSKLW